MMELDWAQAPGTLLCNPDPLSLQGRAMNSRMFPRSRGEIRACSACYVVHWSPLEVSQTRWYELWVALKMATQNALTGL